MLAKEKQTKLKIALEINVGLQRGGFDRPQEIQPALELIHAKLPHAESISGLVSWWDPNLQVSYLS